MKICFAPMERLADGILRRAHRGIQRLAPAGPVVSEKQNQK